MIDAGGFSDDIYVELPNDEVVSGDSWLVRRVDLFRAVWEIKDDVDSIGRKSYNVPSIELSGCSLLAKHLISGSLDMIGRYRWMMTDLFCDKAEFICHELKSLTKKRIEWFLKTPRDRTEACHFEDRDEGQSHQRVRLLSCFLQELIAILIALDNLLGHR